MPTPAFPATRALVAQLIGACCVALFAKTGVLFGFSLFSLACLQGVFAALTAALMRADRWWLPLHLVFLPAVLLVGGLGLPRWVWAVAFGLLALIYWTSFRTQVPLFLSNRRTVAALAEALPDGPLRVLDKSMVSRPHRARPHWPPGSHDARRTPGSRAATSLRPTGRATTWSTPFSHPYQWPRCGTRRAPKCARAASWSAIPSRYPMWKPAACCM